MEDQDHFSQETEVAVWGPTQSGKDWLYRGFAKELEYYNHNNGNSGFRFDLRTLYRGEDNYRSVLVNPPDEISPTSSSEDHMHSFQRMSTQKDDAHLISAHTHKINFHNNRGADLVASLMDPNRFEEIFLAIVRSRFLLITLDPKFENQTTGTDDDYYPDIAMHGGLSKDQYFQILSMLLQTLADKNIPDRYIAVCMTKLDAIKVTDVRPWVLLERVFGQRIYKLLNDYRTTFNIEAFATSAAGYVHRKDGPVPNFDGGKLLDKENWDPRNCAAPFFWVFQNSELERIRLSSNFLNKESNLRKYIKYPSWRNI
jgi:hypothetical protein